MNTAEAWSVEDLVRLRDLAVPIVREAGTFVLAGLHRTHNISTKDGATDLVTQVDRGAEALIVERLQSLRPDDGVLSEEGTCIEGTSGMRWVCDPLDGTANFVRRRHPFVVSLAATAGAETLLGVVYDPWLNELYDAVRGAGARLNGNSLRCSSAWALDTAVVVTAFARKPSDRIRNAALLRELIGDIGDIRRTGAAVYDLCSVAANRAEGYFFESLKPWDLHAAALIAAEAGARVMGLDGGPARPGQPMLAAAPEIADQLRHLIVAASPRAGSQDRDDEPRGSASTPVPATG